MGHEREVLTRDKVSHLSPHRSRQRLRSDCLGGHQTRMPPTALPARASPASSFPISQCQQSAITAFASAGLVSKNFPGDSNRVMNVCPLRTWRQVRFQGPRALERHVSNRKAESHGSIQCIPKVVLLDGADGPHLADFTTGAHDLDSDVRAGLNAVVFIVRELRRRRIRIVLDLSRDHLRRSVNKKIQPGGRWPPNQDMRPVGWHAYMIRDEELERADVGEEAVGVHRVHDSIDLFAHVNSTFS